jgi:hypothetical protein
MKPTLKCGKHVVESVKIAGSRFHDVDLSGAEFDDINMAGTRFHNINFSDISISAVQMGGAVFRHVGLPPATAGKQRPLRFEECDLNATSFERCDLSNVAVRDCDVSGMKINGIAVEDLLKAYQSPR